MGASYSSTLKETKSVSGLDPSLSRKAICNSLVIVLNEASDTETFGFFHGEGTGNFFQQMEETLLCFLWPSLPEVDTCVISWNFALDSDALYFGVKEVLSLTLYLALDLEGNLLVV